MTAYNRIGLQYAATHKTLMMTVLRGEWGYEGTIIDDALTYRANYSVGPDMLMAGTNMWCLDGNRGKELKDAIENTDDGAMLKELQEANKHIFFSMINSSMGGSVDANTVVSTSMNWWQGVLVAIDVVLGVAAVGAIVLFVLTTYKKKAVNAADNSVKEENGNEL